MSDLDKLDSWLESVSRGEPASWMDAIDWISDLRDELTARRAEMTQLREKLSRVQWGRAFWCGIGPARQLFVDDEIFNSRENVLPFISSTNNQSPYDLVVRRCTSDWEVVDV